MFTLAGTVRRFASYTTLSLGRRADGSSCYYGCVPVDYAAAMGGGAFAVQQEGVDLSKPPAGQQPKMVAWGMPQGAMAVRRNTFLLRLVLQANPSSSVLVLPANPFW